MRMICVTAQKKRRRFKKDARRHRPKVRKIDFRVLTCEKWNYSPIAVSTVRTKPLDESKSTNSVTSASTVLKSAPLKFATIAEQSSSKDLGVESSRQINEPITLELKRRSFSTSKTTTSPPISSEGRLLLRWNKITRTLAQCRSIDRNASLRIAKRIII